MLQQWTVEPESGIEDERANEPAPQGCLYVCANPAPSDHFDRSTRWAGEGGGVPEPELLRIPELPTHFPSTSDVEELAGQPVCLLGG